jgi:opacity protein-like surface antigen
MKKTLALALLLVSGVYAENFTTAQTFIGLDLGYSQVKGYIKDGSSLAYEDDSDMQYGFRIGAENEKWRTTFIFGYYDNGDTDQNVEEYLMTIDYFLTQELNTIRPYIGANIGYANYEADYVEDEGGIVYGGQLGFTVDLVPKVNMDLSYRYSVTDFDELDHTGGVMLGVNYKF